MRKITIVLVFVALTSISTCAQNAVADGGDFRLALPSHRGQLRWSAAGFTVVQSSAKPNSNEIGIRAKDASGRVAFLGFLFLVSGQSPLTSGRCRDGALEPEKKINPDLKIGVEETIDSGAVPVVIVNYTTRDQKGKTWHHVRGFVATGDMCGDLEFYSDAEIASTNTDIKTIFATYRLDQEYAPTFKDALIYAQILYNARMYKPAAPIYELALSRLADGPTTDIKTWQRVLTDQAGMAYGISGNIPKARAIFETAIAKDPDYPLYYYNLACADAEEKNLSGARKHLQEAFARKANVLAGEHMPNPLEDDSFLPYRGDKEFWTFLTSLQSNQ